MRLEECLKKEAIILVAKQALISFVHFRSAPFFSPLIPLDGAGLQMCIKVEGTLVHITCPCEPRLSLKLKRMGSRVLCSSVQQKINKRTPALEPCM